MNGHDCTNNAHRNQSDYQVYTPVQALMAESVTKRLMLVHDGLRPVAGNGRLIAGDWSISDQRYWMVFLGCVSQDLAMSGLVLIVRLQIYGYVSSICTKLESLLSLLASATDAFKSSPFVTGTTVTLYIYADCDLLSTLYVQ